MSEPLAWLDGALLPRAEARVSIDDFAVRYGAAAFETMRAAGGRVFRLDAHLMRLRAGLAAMGVPAPDEATLRAAIDTTLAANALRDASVRLTVTAGRGRRPDLAAAAQPAVFVTADPIGAGAPAPLRLVVASLRIDAARPLAGAKTAQFLTNLLARAEARAAGADDALLLNHAGAVSEAATANLFAILGGAVVTPALADGPLPGVTRAAVLECARAIGVPAEERTLSLADLAAAEELFLTSSVVGPHPVASLHAEGVDWTRDAPGPLTVRLSEAYVALVRRETAAPPA
jgi:branched-chain amino acid aminotransferase